MAAVIGIIFLPAVEVNKYNTLYYLWAASIIAGSLWAGSGWGAITFPSIPANMQSFVLIDISTHVCPLFSSRHEGTKAPRKRNKKNTFVANISWFHLRLTVS